MMYANQGARRPDRSVLRRLEWWQGRAHSVGSPRRIAAVRGCATLCVLGALMSSSPAGAGWRTFTTADGLGGNNVRGLIADHNETLWFATWLGGVSHYDGVTWRVYTTADGLGSNNAVCVFEARDSSIWVGTSGGGATRIRDGSLQTFTPGNSGLASNFVNTITQDRDGTMWFGTDNNGAFSFDGSTWRHLTVPDLPDYVVYAIHQDSDGDMWFGTRSGACKCRGATCVLFGGLAGPVVRDIVEDGERNLWFATNRGVTRRSAVGEIRNFTTDDGLAGNMVWAVAQDRRGRMWFVSQDSGVSRYDGRTWRSYGVANTWFTFTDGYDIAMDASGNLWFGTSAGALQFDGSIVTTFTDGPRGPAFLVSEDQDGALWFGTAGKGVFRYDGSDWTNPVPDTYSAVVMHDNVGNHWVPTYERPGFAGGVILIDTRGHVRTWTKADGLASNQSQNIIEDRNHNIWVTHTGGISRFAPSDSTWTRFTRENSGLVDNDVLGAFQDRAGNLWFGTRNFGVSRLDSLGRWRTFTMADGLVSNFVLAMIQDRDDYIWFTHPNGPSSAVQGGLSRFLGEPTPGGVERIQATDGLRNNVVLCVTQIRNGNIWIGLDSGGGPMRWDGSDWRGLDVSDGLPDGSCHWVEEDSDGYLWITTNDGVARYERDLVAPRTVISAPPTRLSASRSQNAVFGALGETDVSAHPSPMEYSYRLDGAAWSSWSSLNAWSAVNLADGAHVLEVRARDYWSNVDPTAEVATFEIDATPPLPAITSPAFGAPVRGTVEITGTASDPRFASYQVWMRPAGAGSWQAPEATRLVMSTTQVAGGVLANWSTLDLADGNYEVRLSVADTLGLEGTDQVEVVVDNHAPFFDQTTPARVTAAAGGNIYTTNAEFHLYVPPHAFSEDAVVTIAPPAEAPPALPGGAEPLGPVYDLGFGGARLAKPATLELSLAGVDLGTSGQVAALYHSADGADWSRLGGTVASGRLSLPITQAGRYALYGDVGGASGGSLTTLSFTPRVFSPSGAFASQDVAIGFTLGRPGAVTVRVYNRAGRMVREVESGRAMGAGANLVRWDGRDRDGSMVMDGLYVVTVEALGATQRRTLAVVR